MHGVACLYRHNLWILAGLVCGNFDLTFCLETQAMDLVDFVCGNFDLTFIKFKFMELGNWDPWGELHLCPPR